MLEVGWLPEDGRYGDADALIAGWFEDEAVPEGVVADLQELAVRALAAGMVDRRRGRTTVLPTYGRPGPSRLVVVGLGARSGYDPAGARLAAALGVRAARASGARAPAVVLHAALAPAVDAGTAVEATVLGVRRGLWRYDGYRTVARDVAQVESVALVPLAAVATDGVRERARVAGAIADSVALAREVDILGANDKFPARVAERAEAYAAQVGLEVQTLDERDLGEMGAGLILGVGQGSVHPPRMVVLRTGASAPGGPVLALVGKGITFDSGGISLKPAAGMGQMKYDLCGAMAVMAALGALARLGSPIAVIGVLCLAENLPGGGAQRPGDVVRSLDGQTVEVDNTDAEGRLVMADGLALARRLGATHLVDVATLTGAIVVALGHAYTGLMSNDDGLAGEILRAAARAVEPVWRMPIDNPMYDRALESDVADVRNVGGREGGALTAAAFLRRFAHDTPWAHLDIAGTAWLAEGDEARVQGIERGPTGVMVETFVHLAQRLGQGA